MRRSLSELRRASSGTIAWSTFVSGYAFGSVTTRGHRSGSRAGEVFIASNPAARLQALSATTGWPTPFVRFAIGSLNRTRRGQVEDADRTRRRAGRSECCRPASCRRTAVGRRPPRRCAGSTRRSSCAPRTRRSGTARCCHDGFTGDAVLVLAVEERAGAGIAVDPVASRSTCRRSSRRAGRGRPPRSASGGAG